MRLTSGPGRVEHELVQPHWRLMGDGVVLDMRHIDRTGGIREAHVRAELDRIGYAIKENDIVLVRTGVSEHYGEAGCEHRHPGSGATRRRISSSTEPASSASTPVGSTRRLTR
jgi:hypothetical protein